MYLLDTVARDKIFLVSDRQSAAKPIQAEVVGLYYLDRLSGILPIGDAK